MYRLIVTVGVLTFCASVVYHVHPVTSPFGAAGPPDGWAAGLVGGIVGALFAGVVVSRVTRKARTRVASRGLDPETAKAALADELAAGYVDSRVTVASCFACLGVLLHLAVAQVAALVDFPHEGLERFAPVSFLVGLLVGLYFHAARHRTRKVA